MFRSRQTIKKKMVEYVIVRTPERKQCLKISLEIFLISNTSDNWNLTEQNLVLYVSQPTDASKTVAHSIDYKIKQKQSELKKNAKKILGFKHFLSKIRDI